MDGVREAIKAGITIGGKNYPVEILVKDSQSNPNRAAEVAADLILKEKIDLMLVASTPETTNPVSDQCELNEVPCVSTIAPWQPWFFGRGGDPAKGFNWTYHFFWGLEDVIAVFTNLWKSVPTDKVVGGLFPNDGDGNAWGDPEVVSRAPSNRTASRWWTRVAIRISPRISARRSRHSNKPKWRSSPAS